MLSTAQEQRGYRRLTVITRSDKSRFTRTQGYACNTSDTQCLTSNPLPVAVQPTMSGFSPSKISYSFEGKACGAPRFPNLGYLEGEGEEEAAGEGVLAAICLSLAAAARLTLCTTPIPSCERYTELRAVSVSGPLFLYNAGSTIVPRRWAAALRFGGKDVERVECEF